MPRASRAFPLHPGHFGPTQYDTTLDYLERDRFRLYDKGKYGVWFWQLGQCSREEDSLPLEPAGGAGWVDRRGFTMRD